MKNIRVLFVAGALVLASAHTVHGATSAEIRFAKGSIAEKISAVRESAQGGDGALCAHALDFALDAHGVLGADSDLELLVRTAVEGLLQTGMNRDVSARLVNVFRLFSSEPVRSAAIDCFLRSPSAASVSLLNGYVAEQMQAANKDDAVLKKAVSALGVIGNSASFNVLFVADIGDMWPGQSAALQSAYGMLSHLAEGSILEILSKVPMRQKLRILRSVEQNAAIPQKIKGAVAENALAESILSVKDVLAQEKEQVELQLDSLRLLADYSWTRAAGTVGSYFPIARAEYESGVISPEQFAEVIYNYAALSSSESGQLLSSYLDVLNKDMEEHHAPDQPVVLAVINALGDLGDKTAFEYLLSVPHLGYPESVRTAAKTALAKLKW